MEGLGGDASYLDCFGGAAAVFGFTWHDDPAAIRELLLADREGPSGGLYVVVGGCDMSGFGEGRSFFVIPEAGTDFGHAGFF